MRKSDQDRLLDKIRVENTRNGHIGIEYMIRVPFKDWPEYLQKNRWIWMGAYHKPRKHRQQQFRADPDNGIRPVIVSADTQPRPYFSIRGRIHAASRVLYSLFVRELDKGENLRYIHEDTRHPMDVNPYHFEPYIRGRNRNKYIPVKPKPEKHDDDNLLPIIRPADLELMDAVDTLKNEGITTKSKMRTFVKNFFPEDLELFTKAAERMKLDE